MTLPTVHQTADDRRGISLLEVLIAIGILSVGLVSVLALIPAGRAQTSKASALDRTALLAMNGAADFIARGFARPSGWTTPSPGTNFVVFDPFGPAAFWISTVSGTTITPRTDAATTATSTGGITSSGAAVTELLVRSEDDLRYSTEDLDEDALPVPQWSINPYPKSPITDGKGRHVFDGAYSYLATLSGTTGTWNPGEYKTLTIVTFSRRDTSIPPIPLTSGTSGDWIVNPTTVPADSSLKDLVKPGAMILSGSANGSNPAIPAWHRVLLVSDMTDTATPNYWKIGLTCEPTDPVTTGTTYLFPGAVGSTQLLIKLEGTSIWNDK